MNLSNMRFITILAEISLEEEIRRKVLSWGAPNCYLTESRSSQTLGNSGASIERTHIRLESICDVTTAEKIITNLDEEYGSDTTITYYISDVLTNTSRRPDGSPERAARLPGETRWGDYLITI